MTRGDTSKPSDRELADLTALADGSLDPGRRPEVEARFAASPELTALLARERRAVEAVRAANAMVSAPDALKARIGAGRRGRRRAVPRRARVGAAFAGAFAAIAIALAVILPAGAPLAPSVSQAASLATLGPASGVPAPEANAYAQLAAGVGDLYFPDWGAQLGWHAVGQRTDTINGRTATTVFYRWRGRQVAYTIVGSPALRVPAAPHVTINGTELRTLHLGGRLVVTWRRDDHTCVLSGAGVPAAELQRLAAWRVPAA